MTSRHSRFDAYAVALAPTENPSSVANDGECNRARSALDIDDVAALTHRPELRRKSREDVTPNAFALGVVQSLVESHCNVEITVEPRSPARTRAKKVRDADAATGRERLGDPGTERFDVHRLLSVA